MIFDWRLTEVLHQEAGVMGKIGTSLEKKDKANW